MKSWTHFDASAWTALVDSLRTPLSAAPSLEAGAQIAAEALAAIEPTALARIYAILPYRELTTELRAFATLATNSELLPSTRILTLMGTAGADPAWRDRRLSRDHQAIPLVSSAQVDAIPMLARLLRELGLDLAWLDDAADVFTRKLVGGFNGVFYAEDAATARDSKGRLVIPATDFVAREKIGTVFGMGGTNLDGSVICLIVFTRAKLSRATVDKFTSFLTMLKGETFRAVLERRFFTA